MSKSTEEKADTAINGVSTDATLGSPADSILYQKFKKLKKQRNHHLIDEPDFDVAVMQLFEQEQSRLSDAIHDSLLETICNMESVFDDVVGVSVRDIKALIVGSKAAWNKSVLNNQTKERNQWTQ